MLEMVDIMGSYNGNSNTTFTILMIMIMIMMMMRMMMTSKRIMLPMFILVKKVIKSTTIMPS